MKSLFFVFLIAFSGVFSVKSSIFKSSSDVIAIQNKKTVKTNLKTTVQKTVKSQKNSSQKSKARREVNREEIVADKKPYKPKVEKEVLETMFNNHLSAFNKNCDLKPEKRQSELEKKLTNFTKFLSESLSDPYMDYETALLFGDVLSVMEKENLESLSTFNIAYKLLYNIGEQVQPEDYYHEWAKVIYKSIKCSSQNRIKIQEVFI